jgi:hypothetical protein
MPIFELIAFLCVTCGAGALLGLGVGVLVGAVVLGAVAGAILGPVVAVVGMALFLYLAESKYSHEWE